MKILLVFLLTVLGLFGAPAYNKLREFQQADGTTFKARAYGNQHLNWIETQDGEVLKYSQKNKNFEYATIKNRSLQPSGTRYEKENSLRARSLGHVSKLNKEELYKLWDEKQEIAHKKQRGLE